MQRRSALGACALLSLTPLFGCKQRANSTELQLGLAIASHVHAVAWIAKDRGLFAAQGVNVNIQVSGGSSAAIRTLVAGQIDVALAGGDSVLKACWAGADLVVIATLVDRFYHRIVARPGLARSAELRGTKLGVPFLGGPQDMAARYALGKLGLAYGKDVEIVSLGKELSIVAALERSEVDLATSELPKARLQRLGLNVIADLPGEPVGFPYLTVSVRRETLETRREALGGFLAALCAATRWYRASENREASLAIITEHLRSADRELARELHEESGPSRLSAKLAPERAPFETALKLSNRSDPGLEQRLHGELAARACA